MLRSRSGGSRWATLAAVALAAAACAADPAPEAARATPQVLPPCVLERRTLVLADGSDAYVEHEQMIPMGDEVLLAGSPSYQWRPRPGRSAERLSSNAFAAAYLDEPGRTVAKPISGTLGSVRVVALDERRWAAIMLQVDPDSLPAVDEFRGLWYGEYDGERWTLVEPMEFPGGRLSSRLSSRLVRVGDRLVWLAMEYATDRSIVHVYERVDGSWTRSVLADADRVEQMELVYLEGSGLWMLLSGYDSALPGFQKSLRLFRQRPSAGSTSPDRWELVNRVAVAEPGVNLRRASLTVQSTGVTVTWAAVGLGASMTLARVGIGPDQPGTLMTLSAQAYYARPAPMPDGSLFWLVDHYETDAPVPGLRLLGIVDGEIRQLASLPSPFTGSFIIRATRDREVLVVGAEMGSDSTDVPVRSLILRLSTSC